LQGLIPSLHLRADERAAEEAIQHLCWVVSACTIPGAGTQTIAENAERIEVGRRLRAAPAAITPAEVKTRSEALVRGLDGALLELHELASNHHLPADEPVAEEVIWHLDWAISNCTILGVHAGKHSECRQS
jgi:hypothetical protein